MSAGPQKRSRALGPATIHVQTETYVETHQINPAFMGSKIEPKIREAREPSESGETDFSGGDLDHVNQSEVGLNSAYMERVAAARKKKNDHTLASFAAFG